MQSDYNERNDKRLKNKSDKSRLDLLPYHGHAERTYALEDSHKRHKERSARDLGDEHRGEREPFVAVYLLAKQSAHQSKHGKFSHHKRQSFKRGHGVSEQ